MLSLSLVSFFTSSSPTTCRHGNMLISVT